MPPGSAIFMQRQVQLLISAIGAVDGLAAFGKGGRIADDETVAQPFVGVGFRKVKDVFRSVVRIVVHAVQSSVAADERERLGRDVDGLTDFAP